MIGLAKKGCLPTVPRTTLRQPSTRRPPVIVWDCGRMNSVLAYTAQLYFDFSGYTDMAIGAALLLGFDSPLNFASPYKARSIIDFWRRWHMTLSRFLRDYLLCSPWR